MNAHPEIVIANELDVLEYVEQGKSRHQLFSLLMDRDRYFASIDYQWTGYDYKVPGQFQGRFTRLRVIGDKRAGRSTHRLGEHPELLEALRRTVGVPIRVIHVVRNPYDNIATMAWRGQRLLAPAMARYQGLSTTVDDVRVPAWDPASCLTSATSRLPRTPNITCGSCAGSWESRLLPTTCAPAPLS